MSRQHHLNLLLAVLVFGGAAAAKAECPAAVLQRLTEAGYDASGASAVCDIARRIGQHGAVMQVRGALVNEAAQMLAQMAVEDPTVQELVPPVRRAVYCGSSGAHTGIVLLAAAAEPFSLDAARCSDSLPAVARGVGQVAAGEGLAVAARIQMQWTPWRLTATIRDVAAASQTGDQLFVTLLLRQVAQNFRHDIPTKDLLVPIALEDSKLRMAVVVYFDANAMTLAFAQGDAPDVDLSRIPSLRGVAGTGLQTASGNASLYVAHGAINDFARDVFTRSPLGIGTVMILGNIALHELHVEGAPGRYSIEGRVTDLEDDVYRASIALSGNDLALQELLVRSEPRDCEGKSCEDENVVRADIAAEASRSGTQILSARNGRAWVQYVEEREFPLPLGEPPRFLKGDVKQTAADTLGLLLHFDFVIVDGGSSP